MAEIKMEGPPSNTEGGALTRLWRKLLEETNRMQALDYMLALYLGKEQRKKGISNIPSLKGKTKSTLMKNIGAPEMTIKTFFDLVFNIFAAKRVVLSIKVTHATGNESIHSVVVEGGVVHESTLLDEQPDEKEGEARVKKSRRDNTDNQ